MPLLYALVARRTAVLAEYRHVAMLHRCRCHDTFARQALPAWRGGGLFFLCTCADPRLPSTSATAGNANTVARAILEKLPTTDRRVAHRPAVCTAQLPLPLVALARSPFATAVTRVTHTRPLCADTRRLLSTRHVTSRVSYSQDRHLFHVLTSSGLCFLCMADEAFGRRVPFAFLEEVKARFTQAYGSQSATALAYAYNTEFSRVLHQQMEYFSSSNSGGDPLSQAKTDLADVRALAVQNIDAVLDRGEKIELLVDKTEVLAGDAFRFKKQASRVKHAQWVKNMKLTVVAVCVGVLILYFLVGMVCGFSLRFCSSQTGNTQATNGPYGRRALLRLTPGGGQALPLQ